MPPLEKTVISAFTERYGVPPSHIARAPGRVNIIGEHVDYSDGFVLPAAIDKSIYVAARRRDDDLVQVQSLDYDGFASFSLAQLEDKALPAWTRYPRGVLWLISRRLGKPVYGLDLTIAGDVPRGAGFSSSAAIEIAMFEAAAALFDLEMSQAEKAQYGVRVEHEFVGVPCGIMDQFISAVGVAGHAVLIDCRSLATTPIPIPAGVSIVMLDTGTRRELVDGEYAERRRQCEEAAAFFGVPALRDVTPAMLAEGLGKLPAINAQRATHAVWENERTLRAVATLKQGDMEAVGRLLNQSHSSLSTLYQVSLRELDIMAHLAQRQPVCYGARMMGGGFGGAVIALVQEAEAEAFALQVATTYAGLSQRTPQTYVAKPGPGSSVRQIG
jgi:galactokinase